MNDTLRGAGYDPHNTPVDTLMAAPTGVGLAVADAMENYDDADDGDPFEGFQIIAQDGNPA